ncbi:uncharacterized vancomycin resistance protein [Chthonomonas calidirosea]|uniref:VanW family protein n=1 Tax=Chthonomonas calidirosea TaxID=454171 RepID=UPI0006DD4F6D|nr:VanW family protein [Chthonomonas calidirosea]CEK17405.1 uncharacterized vancomycin resistance protein [Chthonomonas calidirosea]
MRWTEALGLGLFALASGYGLLQIAATSPPREVRIAGYVSSLRGRSPSQRRNARLAAWAVNGAVVPPGGLFSFDKRVGSWSADHGYVQAPVSYDGELVNAVGGGVCQTSSTLYNAALLAGMQIVERHPHHFCPEYVPPGRDAAVAQTIIDLRFKNPYPWPVRIECRATQDTLEASFWAPKQPTLQAHVETQILSTTQPQRKTMILSNNSRGHGLHARLLSIGVPGYRVITYRTFTRSDGTIVRRERISDSTYAAADRIIGIYQTSLR